MESIIMGGSGGVPGGANIVPELYVGIYQAVVSGDLGKAKDLHREVMQISKIV